MITRDDLIEAAGTAAIHRWMAVEEESFWAGWVATDPEAASGWHHHGDHDTVIYVLTGRMTIESAEGGQQAVCAAPGEWLHIPRHTVHRETNPDPTAASAVVIRIGTGPPVFNVDGPS